MKKIVFILIILSFLVSCSNKYKLELDSPKTIQVSQKLNVTVSEKNGKPIDSVRYYLDGQQVEVSSNIDISDKKLGKHAISATVFYGDEQKKLTNTIFFLGVNSPVIYSYEVINAFPHDENAFTQGLEYYNGFLDESTGQFGESSLRKIEIISGKILSLKKIDFGKPPHTVIIPGRLHFTESDALKLFGQCIDEPFDNTEKTEKISIQMMKKYVPMVREALEEVEPLYKVQKEFQGILENAELYVKDAEKFLEDGQDEVAILSIGYADGLVDALRLAKGLDPKM